MVDVFLIIIVSALPGLALVVPAGLICGLSWLAGGGRQPLVGWALLLVWWVGSATSYSAGLVDIYTPYSELLGPMASVTAGAAQSAAVVVLGHYALGTGKAASTSPLGDPSL